MSQQRGCSEPRVLLKTVVPDHRRMRARWTVRGVPLACVFRAEWRCGVQCDFIYYCFGHSLRDAAVVWCVLRAGVYCPMQCE